MFNGSFTELEYKKKREQQMEIKLSSVMLLSRRIESIVDLLDDDEKITYKELCDVIERLHGIKYNPHNKWVSVALYEICKRDASYDRPLKTVRVINKWSGKPGPGFFSAASALGYQFDDQDEFVADTMKLLA